jgi:hypothetical protein
MIAADRKKALTEVSTRAPIERLDRSQETRANSTQQIVIPLIGTP